MLHSLGKIMTLKKGSIMKNIDYQDILNQLEILGYKTGENNE